MFIVKIIRIIILILILWNIPSFLLQYQSSTLSSIASYFTSALFLVYFLIAPKSEKLAFPFIVLGLLYFLFSSFNYHFFDVDNYFIKEFLRLMIIVVCGSSVIGQTNNKELFYIILLGALSILFNAILFPQMSVSIGRHAGFYLNANTAGALCILGFGLTYAIKEKHLKFIGQLIFTLGGILTFSRTFIVIWIAINIIAIFRTRKNLLMPLVGIIGFIIIFSFSDELSLNKQRFTAIQNLIGGGTSNNTTALQEDSRNETWAKYYDSVMDNPWIGQGFMSFQRPNNNMPGVHNTYLMILGESGIIPFLLHLGIYIYMLIISLKMHKTKPEYINLTISVMLFMLTSHTYFVNFYLILISMYIYVNMKKDIKSQERENIIEQNTLGIQH